MMRNGMKLALLVAFVVAMPVLTGCAGAQKTMPHMGVSSLGIEAEISRQDLEVMAAVEGSSSTTSILLGLIQIIDGQHYKVFGIPFFKDKYTYFDDGINLFGLKLRPFGVGPEDRAYYRALEKQADADAVLVKSMDREQSGIPLIYSTADVTFRGKAVKIKSDN